MVKPKEVSVFLGKEFRENPLSCVNLKPLFLHCSGVRATRAGLEHKCEAPRALQTKRAKGFEPSTFGMEGRRSTTELRPQGKQ